ncbi:ribonuclease III [candidate division WWE3 bacterium RIFCSPHIGHO2_01_FULL_35_17]|uniref:Ribonuclease 3 n=1 Tax=candidate division WWE3 bacterium RIFCSPHIGHO2_01_FULL_35_17 TaxID=1802614 RepID=A0A1F4URI5_UNCKA|nr:MAG: ribonuclease III [candidate division WWE3 bacterium RIFCSPHIGHO2_01_FULL_35_17]
MTIDKFPELQKKLNIKFNDVSILQRALTHRSYINENPNQNLKSNERLEFLGDAILQYLTSEHIFKGYDSYPEGELTNLRARLVNTVSLAEESSRLGLSDYLFISNGEKEIASESNHILANTFEATIAAIYLDQGMQVCSDFVNKELLYKTEDIVQKGELKDPKSLFQEISQEKFLTTPNYKLIEDDGPDHDKTFIVGAYIAKKLIAEGKGSSKRKAEQDAAENALKKIKP